MLKEEEGSRTKEELLYPELVVLIVIEKKEVVAAYLERIFELFKYCPRVAGLVGQRQPQ